MRNCLARIATERFAAQKNLNDQGTGEKCHSTPRYAGGNAENKSYRPSATRLFLKVARKARIPLYLSFAQRKQS
jgi:hypothetical protein